MTHTTAPSAQDGATPDPPAAAAAAARRRLLEAGEGTTADAFGARDWGTIALISLTWGSSFLLIDVGLDAFRPGLLALLRVGLGFATLATFRRARQPIGDRGDLLRIAALGWIWIGVPFLLFPVAQQYVDSSVAGMINGGVPVMSALWATLLLRRLPGRVQLAGIALGAVGLASIFVPQMEAGENTALGAGLLLLAVVLYGLSTQLVVPLQQRYGGLAVIWRAQASALVLITPVGLAQLGDSTFAWGPALAMVPLGILGTGLALVWMANLVGRVGGARGSVAIYIVPLVSIVLGITFLDEVVPPLALGGMVLVLGGAWLTSRAERR